MAHRAPLLVFLLAVGSLLDPGRATGAHGLVRRARLHRPHHGVQVRLAPFEVDATHEREVCQAITTPNRTAMDVQSITVAMPSGKYYASHHFAVFLPGTGPVQSGKPVDAVGCLNVGADVVSPILAFVQRSRQALAFPEGVGVTVAPHQVLLLNSHYVNGGSVPVTPDVAVNLIAARRGSIQHHARSFQLGTVLIDVPPNSEASASASWPVPFPMNLVLLTTHSHKHTVMATVDLERGGVPSSGHEVETRRYAEPTVNRYGPALRLEPGDVIHWTCDYRNATDQPVHFGVTSEDEMCFALGFFYPDDDAALLPPVERCAGRGEGLVCPFN